MSVITGVIETVSIRDGANRKGPWKLTSAKVDGEWFKTFNGDLGKQLVALEREVVELEYEVEERGEYSDNKVKGVKKAQTPEVQKAFTETPTNITGNLVSRGFQAQHSDKDTNIAKAVALKAAVDAIEFGAYGHLEAYVQDVGRLADCFVSWLQNRSLNGSPTAPGAPSQGEIDLVVRETETSLPGTF